MSHKFAKLKIQGEEIRISDTAVIEEPCELAARKIQIGDYVHIQRNCRFRSLNGPADKIIIGDCSFIGHDTNVLVPAINLGDYVTIHNNSLIYGFKPCTLGHNCWIGQNCILNSNETLKIGNNVGIGAYSQVWTHVYFGELLEGCQIFNVSPTIIEDDVWLIGHCIVSPGLSIGKKAIVLGGSMVTSTIAAGTVYGGTPAKDLTDRFPKRKIPSLHEKFEMMKKFAEDFVEMKCSTYNAKKLSNGYRLSSRDYEFRILFVEKVDSSIKANGIDTILITMHYEDVNLDETVSLFNLETKTYKKRKTLCERLLIKFLNSYRARFLPMEEP